ncbi:hypothetical protein KPA97_64930, partial [Burkholderia cenocepacia]|nr:hypothetical protein [Burkholderia cenocepacia]MDR5670780.1 hypothetical protein [Burkholderia cenocepacia]
RNADTFDEALGASPGKRLLKALAERTILSRFSVAVRRAANAREFDECQGAGGRRRSHGRSKR